MLHHGVPPVRIISHSLKLVDYLLEQADKQWYNYYINTKRLYSAVLGRKCNTHLKVKQSCYFKQSWGWSGGAKVLCKSQCRGVLLIWIVVGQGPIVHTVGAGGGCLDSCSIIYHFSFLFPCLWETARYRLKYCLKGPLSP